ncbi:MAG: inositol monophosphatase [Campylobacteraceae bacterium]|jgi:myo-inositol-1(or 4)-monophosphatase|nr:inositol monophosphatase [Campylobacteraceae bacterium]
MDLTMDFLQAVINANLEIYNLLQNIPHTVLCEKLSKGFGGDISKKVDMEAESILVKHLGKFGRIYSEESGMIGDGSDIIIIDPIDGSENFISNIPYFGTSVAKQKDGITTHAVVANMSNGSLYVKSPDTFQKYSLFNSKKEDIVLNPHSSIGIFEKSYSSDKLHNFLKNKHLKYRSMGALALSLSIAHEVNFVLYEGRIREFDIAGGWYMCENLFRFKNNNFLLVSKDKGIFDKISNFIKEQSLNGFF